MQISTYIALLSLSLAGCGRETPAAPPYITGRWKVVDSEGMSVPNSLFWFSMDYLEFHGDGEVWALVRWPPGSQSESELRLNKTGRYALVGQDQIEFPGSCRHQDPCVGRYTLEVVGDSLRLTNAESWLLLELAGPVSRQPPPGILGPSPSPTPPPGR